MEPDDEAGRWLR